VLARTGLAADAERHFRQAIRIDPGSARAHHNLGILLLDQGRAAEASAALDRAEALDPGVGRAR